MENNANTFFLTKKGLSYNSPEFENIAKDIQGNILKGHGRDHVTLLFFTFNQGKVDEAKTWLHTFGTTQLTTAAKQKEQTLNFQKNQEQTFFFGLYLAASCYEYLELNAKQPNDPQFIKAMTDASVMADLEDPPVSKWEKNWQKPIHGCVLIAYNGERTELNLMSRFIAEDLAPFADFFKEKGDGLKNEYGDDIEHFGYVDGISQPKFFEEQIGGIPTDKWDSIASWDLVLTDDEYGSYGSYWVFRKLEQNVQLFKTDEMRIAYENKLWGKAAQTVAAQTVGAEWVGRWKNGMPRTLAENDETIGNYTIEPSKISTINNFNYHDDPDVEGINRCPFWAHIRRVNPRDESLARIARRGIPYGKRTAESRENPIKHGPTEGVGLLFQCFQSDIGLQFEAIQKAANRLDEEGKNDPIIGCPKLNQYVKLKGGGYFFAPSRLFFESLKPNFSQRNLIEDMTTTQTVGTVNNAPNASASVPVRLEGYYIDHSGDVTTTEVLYATPISQRVENQYRDEIKKELKKSLTMESSIDSMIDDLFNRTNPILCDYLEEIHRLREKHKQDNPNRATMIHNIKEGRSFMFKDVYTEKIRVGAVVVDCGGGRMCCQDEPENFVAPIDDVVTIDGIKLNPINISTDGQWYIYKIPLRLSLDLNTSNGNVYNFRTQ